MWVRVDDALPDDGRVAATGPAAVGVLVCSLCYSNRNRTYGWIPKGIVARFCGADLTLIDAMVTVGMLKPVDRDGLAGFLIHQDYLQYQFTQEQDEEYRQQRVEAGRAGGIRSGKARRYASRKRKQSEKEATTKRDASIVEAKTNSDPDPVSRIPVPNSGTRSNESLERAVRQKPDESNAVMTKLAHTVLDVVAGNGSCTYADVVEALKDRCAHNRIPYSGDAITRAIESANYQRQRAGKSTVLPGTSSDAAFTLKARRTQERKSS